jgi:hypothetical protein
MEFGYPPNSAPSSAVTRLEGSLDDDSLAEWLRRELHMTRPVSVNTQRFDDLRDPTTSISGSEEEIVAEIPVSKLRLL